MRAPELATTPEKIDKIINRINSGDIRIPAFQRAYVWKQNQILELLDSVVKNYPIGSVLLWSTSVKLKHTRNIAGYKIPDNADEYPVNYVLDGQQRISSIYATFSDKTEQDAESADYNPNLNLFEIYYNFSTMKFEQKGDVDTTANDVIYLRNFLNGAKLIESLKILDPKFHNDAQELYSRFINYELPVVTIKNREKFDVANIFERINNTGTKLSTLDLMTAWTWTDDFHLLESINELQVELDEKNFGDLTQNILLQAISGYIQNNTTTKSITELTGEQVRDNWEGFCEALRKTIDFIGSDLNCSHLDFLPWQQQIIGLVKFFGIDGMPSANQLKELKKWFWKTSFSNRYSTGQTTEKMNVDIERISEIRKNDFVEASKFRYNVTKGEIIETKFSKANPLTRALLLLMAQKRPLDLIKNSRIDIAQSLSKYNRKQYHHIFPNAFLKKQGFPSGKIFSLANFCFLPADSNKKISKKSPSNYFFSLIPQDNFNNILSSNLIPLTKDLYSTDNYNDFLEKRAELIINEVDAATN
ncbi:MAG TPA: DUF262 domain-containing protein [Hanamia sp.]